MLACHLCETSTLPLVVQVLLGEDSMLELGKTLVCTNCISDNRDREREELCKLHELQLESERKTLSRELESVRHEYGMKLIKVREQERAKANDRVVAVIHQKEINFQEEKDRWMRAREAKFAEKTARLVRQQRATEQAHKQTVDKLWQQIKAWEISNKNVLKAGSRSQV